MFKIKCLNPCMQLWDKHTPRAASEGKTFNDFDNTHHLQKKGTVGKSIKKKKKVKSPNLFYTEMNDT